MKRDASDKEDITIDTKQDSEKKECYDIGNQKKWMRNCPKCNNIVHYKSYVDFWYGRKCNSLCSICKDLNKNVGEVDCYDIITRKRVWLRNCPRCNKTLFYSRKDTRNSYNKKQCICCSCVGFERQFSEKTKEKLSKIFKGKIVSLETRKRMSENNKGMSGKHHSVKSKRKIRLYQIKRIENVKLNGGQLTPNYNSKSCKFIGNYGKQHGYNFQLAENGGEFFIKKLGYWVDGYDKEKNVVFEYDEPKHYSVEKLKEKDIHRMNEIIQHLGCRFIRYNEQTNEVKEF